MGQTLPPPPPPPPPTLTNRPWREHRGWEQRVRDELVGLVSGLAPQTQGQLDVPFFNIALTGQVGSGKSSFINSVTNIFQGIGVKRADTGLVARSLTNKYRIYDITLGQGNESHPLSWRICDTMGLEESKSYNDVANILKAVDGHLPDRYVFPDSEIYHLTRGYIPNPEMKDKSQCVAVVINGKYFNHMDDVMKGKLKTLRTSLLTREIPTYVLLTHIDEACDEVQRDVKNVYRSIAIRDLVHKVGRMLYGLPLDQIFPVMNYTDRMELDDGVDILLLYALRHMLRGAQGHLQNQM